MPYPLTEWWFWVFVAPEAVFLAGWLVFMIFAGVGAGGAWVFDRFRRRDSERD